MQFDVWLDLGQREPDGGMVFDAHEKGPGHGLAKVYVDGAYIGSIDLGAATTQPPAPRPPRPRTFDGLAYDPPGMQTA